MLVSKVFGGLSKKKEVKPLYSYEIVGYGGALDGVLLQKGERFSRSWTILNTSTYISKDNDSKRVVRIIQHSGVPLKEYVLFLWPAPGATVTVGIY